MTTDGASNERGAARLLVEDGNELHCAAHNIQLVINDIIDPKQVNAPPACARLRTIVRKAHLLVTHINGHKIVYQAFSLLAKNKQATAEGERSDPAPPPPPCVFPIDSSSRNFTALITNTETRWDSELAMLERLCYFDNEIMALYTNDTYGITPEMMLDRFEFDVAYGMTLVLLPFRLFTKAVQFRNRVTTAHVPHLLDDVLSHLDPGAFAQRLVGRAAGVLEQIETFQLHLVAGIRERFADVFAEGSVALAAAYLLPGPNPLTFINFPLADNVEQSLIDRILDDVVSLMPVASTPEQKQRKRNLANSALEDARAALDEADPSMDPLDWWPSHGDYRVLFDAVKMYLAIPASTADDERVFSGAAIVLNPRRTRLDQDNFRRESRIRQYITLGNPVTSQQGRQARMHSTRTLMERLEEELAQRRAARAAAAPAAPAQPPVQ